MIKFLMKLSCLSFGFYQEFFCQNNQLEEESDTHFGGCSLVEKEGIALKLVLAGQGPDVVGVKQDFLR